MKGRTAFLAIHFLVIVLSVLIGLRVLPGPDLIGAILAFYVLFVLPGLLLERLFFDVQEVTIEGICRIFCMSLVFVSLVVSLGIIPGVSYMTISLVVGGASIVLLVAADKNRSGKAASAALKVGGLLTRRREDGPRRNARLLLVILLFCACFVFFYESGELGWSSDALDHLSFIRRSVDSGEIFPRDSYYKAGDGPNVLDPRKGLWHPVVSLWVYQADVDPVFLWRILPSFMIFFAFAAFAFFALELLGSGWRVALAVLFFMLFFRGEGIGWLTKIGFSRNMAQVILWIDAALLLRFYRFNGTSRLILAALLALIGAAYHIMFAFLLAVILAGVLVYMLLSRSGRRWRGRYVTGIFALLPAVGIPLVLRQAFTMGDFNYIHTHRQGMLLLSDTLAVVDPVEVLSRLGLAFFFALFLSPFIFRIGPRGYRRQLVGVLFALPVLVVFIPWIAVFLEHRMGYLYYRLLYAAPTMCLLTLGVIGLSRIIAARGILSLRDHQQGGGAERSKPRAPRKTGTRSVEGSIADRAASVGIDILKRLVAGLVIALFLYYPARFAFNAFSKSVETILRDRSEMDGGYTELIGLLEKELPHHCVIISDPQTSYLISAFTDHFVVVTLDQHCSPADAVAFERLRAVRDIFSPSVPLESCRKWFVAFDADYLLLNTNTRGPSDFFETTTPDRASFTYEKFASCPSILRERYAAGGFHLFEVMPEAQETLEPRCYESIVPLVALPAGGTAPAGVVSLPVKLDTGTGIVLDSLLLRGGSHAPGDTVSGSLYWRSVSPIAYGLPIEWVMRLDTEYPRGAFFRNWYSKQFRRIIERRNGVRYRFTVTDRVRSGFSDPDQWPPGERVRQDFSFVLPERMVPGGYELRFRVYRRPYLPNRRIADYLRNEDSMHGQLVGALHIGARSSDTP